VEETHSQSAVDPDGGKTGRLQKTNKDLKR
jgi:hypothetical protein